MLLIKFPIIVPIAELLLFLIAPPPVVADSLFTKLPFIVVIVPPRLKIAPPSFALLFVKSPSIEPILCLLKIAPPVPATLLPVKLPFIAVIVPLLYIAPAYEPALLLRKLALILSIVISLSVTNNAPPVSPA